MVALAAPVLPLGAQVSSGARVGPPLKAGVAYTGDLMGNVSGGVRRGTVYLGAGYVELTLLPDRLVGWRGGRVFLSVLGTLGGAPSALVGDDQGLSDVQAPGGVRVEEVWLQQNLLHDRLSLLAGRWDVNAEFDCLSSASLFVNSSFGVTPEFSSSGTEGPSVFPRTSVGSRVAFRPWPGVVLRVGVLDGTPVDRADGHARVFASGDGALLVGEIALLSDPQRRKGVRERRFSVGRGFEQPYDGKVALGAWYYTARYPDLAAASTGGRPVLHHGSRGMYLIGEQTLLRPGPSRPRTLTAFAQLGLGDGRVNQVGAYVGGGLTLDAPFPGRPQDQLGLAVASALDGTHFQRARAARGLSTVGAESAFELTYLIRVGAEFSLQPDLQYIVHPGGTGDVPDALALTLRTHVGG